MEATKRERQFSVAYAAERFSKTPVRIRQICATHGIGELVGNRVWILRKHDIEKIAGFLRENGRKSGPRKKI